MKKLILLGFATAALVSLFGCGSAPTTTTTTTSQETTLPGPTTTTTSETTKTP
ncbi:MAG: hypothetical protein H7067_17130 [Burkholderiales bacterium]|nr:hypothetical protein [Opitutaceae bacterium]